MVIKLLAFGGQMQWSDLKLFEREAQILRELDHPCIPQYRDYFRIDENILYPKQHRTNLLLVVRLFSAIPLTLMMIGMFHQVSIWTAKKTLQKCAGKEKCEGRVEALERLSKAGQELGKYNLNSAKLYSAKLYSANLKDANFRDAYLKSANLKNTNLIGASHLTNSQIKKSCNWEKAIYKGNWDENNSTWIVDEAANQEYIQQLKQDKASAPRTPVNCSRWE